MRTNRGRQSALVRVRRDELRPNTGRPPNGLRRTGIGRRRSGIACAQSPAISRRPRSCYPSPVAPPPSWPATQARPSRACRANCAALQTAFNDVTYGERPGTESCVPDDRRAGRPSPRPRRRRRGRPERVRRRATAGSRCDDRHHVRGRRHRRPAVADRCGGCCWPWSLIVGVSAVSAYLTAPRQGGRMDPDATSPDGAHALVTLLRDRGVDVVDRQGPRRRRTGRAARLPAADGADRPISSTTLPCNDSPNLPGDVLLVEPTSWTREALAPEIERRGRHQLRRRTPTATCAKPPARARCSSASATPTSRSTAPR